jgi:hypothetical protein
MTEFARLDIKEIRTDVPRANFTEAKIDQIADLILVAGGVIRPLVVKQIAIDCYELMDGALEYYAAVRAREKDPRRGELVNAFVIPPKAQEVIKAQLASLKEDQPKVASPAATTAPAPDQLSAFITNFIVGSEARIYEMRELIWQNQRTVEAEFKRLDKLVEKAKKPNDLLDLINELPIDDLKVKLAFHGADKAKIEAICAARQQMGSRGFATYQELLSTAKGLGEKGLLRLIDGVRSYSR